MEQKKKTKDFKAPNWKMPVEAIAMLHSVDKSVFTKLQPSDPIGTKKTIATPTPPMVITNPVWAIPATRKYK